MTELKKLNALVVDVEKLAKTLIGQEDQEDQQNQNQKEEHKELHITIQKRKEGVPEVRYLHEISEEFSKYSSNLRERTDKMLVKAREKDPDHQMYNESTCAKIEVLGTEVDRVLALVSEDRMDEVQSEFVRLLRQEALASAAQQQMAASASVIEAQEKDARVLVLEDKKMDFGIFSDQERKSKTEVYRIEGERAAAKWRKEEERRAAELADAEEIFDKCQRIPKAFAREVFVEAHLDKLRSEKHRAHILERTREILRALIGDPEQEGLRTMRTDAERFVKTFGHAYLNNGEEERKAVRALEVVLFGVGYRVQYTAAAMINAWATQHNTSSVSHSPAGKYFDCDRTGNPNKVSFMRAEEIPWILYGDRRLVLQEPSVIELPDEWMLWHDRLKQVARELEGVK